MLNDDYQLIEEFLKGALDEQKKAAFFTRLEEDPSFAEAYAIQKSMHIYLKKDANQVSVTAHLNALGNNFFSEEKEIIKIIPLYRKPWFIGLVVAASIALILFVWNPFSSTLYDQYAVHNPLALTEKSVDTSLASNAEQYFNQQEYEPAYQTLVAYLKDNPLESKAQLALGICALETNRIAEAKNIFTTLQQGTSAQRHYGTWYLGLLYLKQEQFQQTKTQFQQIPSSETYLYRDAQDILKKI